MSKLLKYLGGIFFIGVFLFASSNNAFAANKSVSILMYHYVRDYHNAKDKVGIGLSVSPANFDAQMAYLSQHGYTPVTLDTLYAIFAHTIAPPPNPVVLTFDDGYIDFYSNAFPILQKYHFHAVSFIPTGLIGKAAYLSWNNIKELQASGLISFEAHTVTHSYLPRMGYTAALNELVTSKNVLQQQTGTSVNFIAYPYGASNANVIIAAKNAGFIGGVGTWGGKATFNSFNMPRLEINGNYSLETFASRL